MKLGVIIPAAGRGKRMNTQINKQYLNLITRPVLAHTINIFINYPLIDQIIVVVRKEEIEYCRAEIINKYFNKSIKSIKLVVGGKTRRQSVFAGLKAFSSAIDYVIIHDGARPLLSRDLIDRLIKSLDKYKAITMGITLKDTIKKVKDGLVVETLNRNELVAIQTPQVFAYDLIMKAHREVPESVKITDDASLVEAIGYPVKVIKGVDENLKITTPLDLIIAERIMQVRRELR